MSTLGNHEEYTERGEGRGNGGTNMLHIEPYLTMTTSRATKPHGNEDLESAERLRPAKSTIPQRLLSSLKIMFRKERNPESTAPEELIKMTPDMYREGYPQLAAVVCSDQNLMLYRRFSCLQARLLLNKQDELRQLENELGEMDLKDSLNDEKRNWLFSRETNCREDSGRSALISKIEIKFNEYAQLVRSAQAFTQLNNPSERDYNFVKNYFDGHSPVVDVERYINFKDDLMTLRLSRERAWLERFFDNIVGFNNGEGWLASFFSSSQPTEATTMNNKLLRPKTKRLENLVNAVRSFVLTIVILALLIIPVYILYKLSRREDAASDSTFNIIILVLVLFTFAFSVVLSAFTTAKRHEVLAAAAAYCAVLVVFVGNVGQINSGGKPGT